MHAALSGGVNGELLVYAGAGQVLLVLWGWHQ